MFDISKEDRDVIAMCNENKRRSDITTTIGYIATQEQAMEYAVSKAVQKRRGGWHWQEAAMIVVSLLFSVATLVVKLAG